MGNCASIKNYNTFKYNNLLSKMSEDIQFTRYLYEKDEVKLSFIISMLERKEERALFWAYELYYSGFRVELTELFWRLYYDFYYALNPLFEDNMMESLKTKLQRDDDKEALNVGYIVINLINKLYSTDVFFMRIFSKVFDFDLDFTEEYTTKKQFNEPFINELIKLLKKEDHMMLSAFILNELALEHFPHFIQFITDYYGLYGLSIKSIMKRFNMITNAGYVREKILGLYLHLASIFKKIYRDSKFIIEIDKCDIEMYSTIEVNLHMKKKNSLLPLLPAYKVLSIASLYEIDEFNYLSLFKLKRDTKDIVRAYHYNWLYHASYSPIWRERIEKHNGKIDRLNECVIMFSNEEDEDTFMDSFNYEPDEQRKEIQDKTIQKIQNVRTWLAFYNDHSTNNIIVIDDDYIKELEKIEYI